jgi:Fe2+ or Zn2+ uptake regulation protein
VARHSGETAISFTLACLSEHSDRELRVKDLYEECQGRFSAANITNALTRLLAEGKVVRVNDADRSAWWAIKK